MFASATQSFSRTKKKNPQLERHLKIPFRRHIKNQKQQAKQQMAPLPTSHYQQQQRRRRFAAALATANAFEGAFNHVPVQQEDNGPPPPQAPAPGAPPAAARPPAAAAAGPRRVANPSFPLDHVSRAAATATFAQENPGIGLDEEDGGGITRLTIPTTRRGQRTRSAAAGPAMHAPFFDADASLVFRGGDGDISAQTSRALTGMAILRGAGGVRGPSLCDGELSMAPQLFLQQVPRFWRWQGGGGFPGHDTCGIERIDWHGDGGGSCSGLGTGPRNGEPPRVGHIFLNQMA